MCLENSGNRWFIRINFHSFVSREIISATIRSLSSMNTGLIGFKFVAGFIQELVHRFVDSPSPIFQGVVVGGLFLPRSLSIHERSLSPVKSLERGSCDSIFRGGSQLVNILFLEWIHDFREGSVVLLEKDFFASRDYVRVT